MSRYTILWTQAARDHLTELWLVAADRNALTKTVHELDLLLRERGPLASEHLVEGLHRLAFSALVVYYTVREPDRILEIDAVGLPIK